MKNKIEKRSYAFASGKKRKMVSIRLDPVTRETFDKINQRLTNNNLPKMSQSEIIDVSVQEFYERLPQRIK